MGQEWCLYIPRRLTLPPRQGDPHPPRQVCPGEWVYHYVDTAKIGAGHYGPGHHLRFTLSKDANEGAAIAMTRHSNVVNVPSCRCHMRHALGMCR